MQHRSLHRVHVARPARLRTIVIAIVGLFTLMAPASADAAPGVRSSSYVFTPKVSAPSHFEYVVTGVTRANGGEAPDDDDAVLFAIAGLAMDEGVPVSTGFAYAADSQDDFAPSATVNGTRYGCPTTHCGVPVNAAGQTWMFGSYTPVPGEPAVTHVFLVAQGGTGDPQISYNDDEWTLHEVELEFTAVSRYEHDATVFTSGYGEVHGYSANVALSAVERNGERYGSVALARPTCEKTHWAVAVGAGSMTLSGGQSGPITRECPYSTDAIVDGVNDGIAGVENVFIEGGTIFTDIAKRETKWTLAPRDGASAGIGRQARLMVINMLAPEVLAELG